MIVYLNYTSGKLPVTAESQEAMPELISENRLKIAASSIIENKELTIDEAVEKVKNLGYFLRDDSQKIAFHLVCSEIQLELSEQLTEAHARYENPKCNHRSELLKTVNELGRKLALAEQISEVTQTVTDHSIRGAIFSINKFLDNPPQPHQ